jgi:hypothetical protein
MYVAMWNIVILTVGYLEVAKFTATTLLSLLTLCKLSLPVVGLEMSSLPTLAVKSYNKIVLYTLRIYGIHVLVPCRSCHLDHHVYPLLGHEHSEQCCHTKDLLVLYMTSIAF